MVVAVRLNCYTPASFDEQMRTKMCAELFQAWVNEQIAERLQKVSSTLAS